MAMTQLMLFITKGSLDAARCKLVVPPPHKEKKGRFRKREEAPKVRDGIAVRSIYRVFFLLVVDFD